MKKADSQNWDETPYKLFPTVHNQLSSVIASHFEHYNHTSLVQTHK